MWFTDLNIGMLNHDHPKNKGKQPRGCRYRLFRIIDWPGMRFPGEISHSNLFQLPECRGKGGVCIHWTMDSEPNDVDYIVNPAI